MRGRAALAGRRNREGIQRDGGARAMLGKPGPFPAGRCAVFLREARRSAACRGGTTRSYGAEAGDAAGPPASRRPWAPWPGDSADRIATIRMDAKAVEETGVEGCEKR